ncbi:hypothetical protein NL108_008996 [Boleophthalmus pectinirostris]|uniref:zona pellucida sperm-binding protein 4-like n=1 Tax=Boleophthalmus pectinirostris TaxID=150288 RepID=UPI00242C6BE9|nr:zona pellucida sperm-binding protein 4-like [Boleophthalmus pectinirostris]KAJ0055048.1 hypothetical protein NL108_008996 [Boleophthalmus pectinirostris]
MGLNRVEFVAFLTWTLLLLSLVQGWIDITNSHNLRDILAGRYSLDAVKPDAHVKLPVQFYNEHDADEDDDEEEEDEYYDNGEDDDDLKSGFYEPQTPPTEKPGPEKEDPTGFHFSCTTNAFKIALSIKEVAEVKIIGPKDLLSVQDAAKSCGYNLNKEKGILIVPFTGCFVKKEEMDFWTLQLLLSGGSQVRTATCPGPKSVKSGLSPWTNPQQTSLICPFTTVAPSTVQHPTDPQHHHHQHHHHQHHHQHHQHQHHQHHHQHQVIQLPVLSTTPKCAFPTVERLPCGGAWMSKQECDALDCCWYQASCFYPMDECTSDFHFVFSIHHDTASLPLDPSSLVIPGTNCNPVILTDTVAVFKFKMNECGTRTFTVGGTQIYLAEVQTAVETLNLKYGAISRSAQLRFLIECRYCSSGNTLASTGYMVITPSSTLPSAVSSHGLYGVELKMAKDETYSSFYPTYHLPLRLLLGRKIYLQLHLLSPTPEAVILVNYCIAYPRSASNALVLVYEGCANPYDPHTFVLLNSDFGAAGNERRFVVKAFQFMEQNTNQYLDEEIYFMCSTEVCFPMERTCEEQCFDGNM